MRFLDLLSDFGCFLGVCLGLFVWMFCLFVGLFLDFFSLEKKVNPAKTAHQSKQNCG